MSATGLAGQLARAIEQEPARAVSALPQLAEPATPARYGFSWSQPRIGDEAAPQSAEGSDTASALTFDVWRGSVVININALQPAPVVEPRKPVQAPARGGLPPRALRRVREYIEQHIEESIGLKDLAEVAGLSMFHFARAFKQSQGATPNCYLFQRRVERAQQLLAESDLPLSEIAIATGFSDQSHFARRFREHVGTTPAKYRWSKR